MFSSSCVLAGTGIEQATFVTLFVFLLIAAIPVIILNIYLHRAIRSIEPNMPSAGIKQAVISSIFLTPYEAAIVLPAINLFCANVLMKKLKSKPNKRVQSDGQKRVFDSSR